MNWSALSAPSLDDIEALARAEFDRLPEKFRDFCDGVMFAVQDFPDDDVLDEMQCETEFDLLGLFQGADLAMRDTGSVRPEPTMIFLYRRPILDYWAENAGTLGEVVRHVLVHEIGHHFGLSDDDMEDIEKR
jgi:predicted Zn-dependent protease with MMP-like domain